MGQIIDFYSRRVIGEGFNGDFVAYDPQMPIAVEIFTDLDKSVLLEGCWVPLSWDENGIVVLMDDPLDEEKRAAVKTELRTKWVIFKAGTKKDIEAFINRAFNELEIDDFLTAIVWDKKPIDSTGIVDIIIGEAFIKGASEVLFESIASAEKGCVWFLMESVWREYMTVPDDTANEIMDRIKSMAHFDIANNDLPKIGRVKFKRDGLPEFFITASDQKTTIKATCATRLYIFYIGLLLKKLKSF